MVSEHSLVKVVVGVDIAFELEDFLSSAPASLAQVTRHLPFEDKRGGGVRHQQRLSDRFPLLGVPKAEIEEYDLCDQVAADRYSK